MNAEDFRDIVGTDVWQRMDLIRCMGNNDAHTGKKITEEVWKICMSFWISWRIAVAKTTTMWMAVSSFSCL